MLGLEQFLLGFLLSAIATYLAVRWFPKFGLLDFPKRYNLKRDRKPYPGGLIFWILSFLLIGIDQSFWVLLLPLLVLGSLSFVDDRIAIPAWQRLLVHVWLAIFLWTMGVKIYYISNPFAETNFEITQIFPHIAFVITVIWIVAIQNAMNWFDGIPGLSVGVGGIGFLTLGTLGIIRPELFWDTAHTSLTQANFLLAGLCLGGFYFYWREKIILGDTGSQILGFLLAVMAIFSGAKIATTLLVLSLPILDFFWTIFRRLFLEKKSPFKGDKSHLHHNLCQFISPQKTTLLLVGISSVFGLIALFLTGYEKMIAFLLVSSLVMILNAGLWWKCKTK